jgi:hypothetical protein
MIQAVLFMLPLRQPICQPATRWWLLTSFLLLWLGVWGPAQAQQLPAANGNGRPGLSSILTPAGTLRPGASGSFDPAGYRLGTDPVTGAPQFRLAGTGDENWQDGFFLDGLDGTVQALALDGSGNVYAGGYFTLANGTLASHVAKWNGSAWSALGSGTDGAVYSLALDASGNLYAGGLFASAGGVANTSHIAKWNGSTWSALGTGTNGMVEALVLDGSGNLYAGGNFTNAGGVANTNYVARWNGSTWSAMGTGANQEVHTLVRFGSMLYVGGYFSRAGGVNNTNHVARWNGSTWSALGTGTNDTVNALAVDGSGILYAGGSFTTAGGVMAGNIARWNGSAWSAVGIGVNSSVYALAVDGSGNVYVGGFLNYAGSTPVSNVAKWNGSTWSAMGTNINSEVFVLAVDGSGNVYAGGLFSMTGGGDQSAVPNRIARWNGSTWTALGPGTDDQIYALAVDGSGNVYVGGDFYTVGGVSANHVAKWNGSTWSALGAGTRGSVYTAGTVYSLAVDNSGNLYVGGNFRSAGGMAVSNIAKWNGSTWSALGSGISLSVQTLAVDGSGNVYAGGFFTDAGGVPANNVAKWNGSTWSALGSGTDFSVNALAVDGSGNVYVGGGFSRAGGILVSKIAKWNGSAWSSLGGGTNDEVFALAVDGSGNVYAGGNFTTAGGVAATRVAKWNGSTWSALGTGADNTVRTLTVDSGGNVYAGGSFTTAGGVSNTSHVAKWNGSAWSALGTGLNRLVVELAVGPNDKLNACGSFTTVGDGSKATVYFGIYTLTSSPVITSLSPTSGMVGTVVTITGSDLTGATGVSFNGTAATSFTVNSPTSITVTVPPGTTTGNVTVTTSNGTSNGLPFTLVTDLTVSTGTPAAPTPIAAGTYNNVTVTGTGNASLGGAVVVNSAFLVQAGGSLTTACQPLTGSGSFTLEAGATLYICDPAGLSSSGSTGAVQVTGVRSFSPGASYVYNGTTTQITGNGLPGQVRDLTTTNANLLTMSQAVAVAQTLTLTDGNLALNGQTLTLLSDASGTALVVQNGWGVATGTTATVQRYLDPSRNAGLGYRHFSSPVSGNLLADLGTATFAPVFTAAYNTSATPGLVTPFPTVFGYDQLRLSTVTSNYSAFDKGWFTPQATSNFTDGQGFAVNIASTEKVDFTGSLRSGDVGITLFRNENGVVTAGNAGWQLMGNPYPAPIDWSRIAPADRTGLDAAMYVFESTSQYAGGYRSYVNGLGGSSPLIGTAQGFFARVSSGQTSGRLIFRDAQRLTSFTDQVPVRRGAADTRPRVQLTLAGQGLTDDLYLYAETGATAGADAQFDAPKLPNTHGLNLASLTATGEALAIDGRPAFTATAIALSMTVPTAGASYTLTAALANLTGTRAELVDNLTGTRTTLTGGVTYAFTSSSLTAPGRFWLNLAPAGALPTAQAALEAQVLTYPNPAHSSLTVLRPASKAAAAELLNSLGQRVRSLALPTTETTIDLCTLPAGVYTLRLTLDRQPVTKRVVVE